MRANLLFGLLAVAACRDKAPAPPPPPAEPPLAAAPAATPYDPSAGPGGSRVVSELPSNFFGLGPGHLYVCAEKRLRVVALGSAAAPPEDRGACEAFDFQADASGAYYCGDKALMHLPPSGPPEKLAAVPGCVLQGLDADALYYAVPSADDPGKSGVYRIAKAGGAPTQLVALPPHEAAAIALDGDDVWIARFGAGTITRIPKRGGKPTATIPDQASVTWVTVDGDSLVWLVQKAGELRRTAKRGGAISVVATGVQSEPVALRGGAFYWFVGAPEEPMQLVRFTPGERAPTVLVSDLEAPFLAAGSDGLYFTEIGKRGIYVLP